MEKNNYSQLELFSRTKEDSDKKIPASNAFLSYIWAYEKTILLIIFFISAGIIAFSLGVEKGKQIGLSKAGLQPELHKPPQVTNLNNANKALEPRANLNHYTIQLASFKNKIQAQKEAEGLRKNGLLPLILFKNGYSVVCVGNFPNKDKALPLLSEFRKRYPDCLIRRL